MHQTLSMFILLELVLHAAIILQHKSIFTLQLQQALYISHHNISSENLSIKRVFSFLSKSRERGYILGIAELIRSILNNIDHAASYTGRDDKKKQTSNLQCKI